MRIVHFESMLHLQISSTGGLSATHPSPSHRQFNDVWSLDLRHFSWQELRPVCGTAPPVELGLREQHFRVGMEVMEDGK